MKLTVVLLLALVLFSILGCISLSEQKQATPKETEQVSKKTFTWMPYILIEKKNLYVYGGASTSYPNGIDVTEYYKKDKSISERTQSIYNLKDSSYSFQLIFGNVGGKKSEEIPYEAKISLFCNYRYYDLHGLPLYGGRLPALEPGESISTTYEGNFSGLPDILYNNLYYCEGATAFLVIRVVGQFNYI